MANIKDVAKLAGVSQSTVSIVLNGKSEQRMISAATQQKVYDAVKALDYHPNVAARKLRESGGASQSIALYWASDFRAQMMVRFFKGLEIALEQAGSPEIEITIHPYKNGGLVKEKPFLTSNKCSAIIVANACEEDLSFLEGITPLVPLVLYNRSSAKYSTVSVDDATIGRRAAAHLAEQGYRSAALLSAPYVFGGMKVREGAFIAGCAGAGVRFMGTITAGENGFRGGVEAASAVLDAGRPEAVFCISDALAHGLISGLTRRGLRLPQDMGILSIGNGDSELNAYSLPSLSEVHIPMLSMARQCMQLILQILRTRTVEKQAVLLDTPLIARESTQKAGN